MYPFTIRLMLLSKGILGNATNCGIMCPTACLLTSTVKRFPDFCPTVRQTAIIHVIHAILMTVARL